MSKMLDGNVALMTGAGRGIGREIAAVAVFLASDVAKDATGQVFAVRKTEAIRMSQPRPLRSVHRAAGWTPETLANHMLPALKPVFVPLDATTDVFGREPV